MKYCESCKVFVNNDNRVKCPLCKANLKKKENDFDVVFQAAPRFSPKKSYYHKTTRILGLCSVAIVALAFLVNMFYYQEFQFAGLWCVSVLIVVLFFWALIRGCIFNFKNFNIHFTVSLVLLAGLSASIEYLAHDPFPRDMYFTLLYVIPGLFFMHFGTLAIRGAISKKTFPDSSIYILFSTLLAIAYMIVFVSVPLFDKLQISGLIGLGLISGITLLAIFVLAPKIVITELYKRLFTS